MIPHGGSNWRLKIRLKAVGRWTCKEFKKTIFIWVVFKSYRNHNHKQKSYKLTQKTYLHSKDVLYSISDVLYAQKSFKVDQMQLKKFFNQHFLCYLHWNNFFIVVTRSYTQPISSVVKEPEIKCVYVRNALDCYLNFLFTIM